MLKPCATCGELSDSTYCQDHKPKDLRQKNGHRDGYDHAWRKLSARARRLQPFCSVCGSTQDLTTDHTPEAWRRKQAGKPIRLQDVDVLCRSCNSKAGAARGKNVRENERAATPYDRVEHLEGNTHAHT